jgi:hypothetical protein
MNYLPQVIKAKHVSGYIVATRFDDGTEKHVDISQWFRGPVFKPLKDPKFFSKFFVEGGALAWPNGVDIAPEALYEAEDLKVSNKKKIDRKEKPRRSS